MNSLLLGITELLCDVSIVAMAKGDVALAEKLMDASDITLAAAFSDTAVAVPCRETPAQMMRRPRRCATCGSGINYGVYCGKCEYGG